MVSTGRRDPVPSGEGEAPLAAGRSRTVAGVTIATMRRSECATAARLHRRVLDAEFITRLGTGFLEVYYRAWVDADDALALVASDDSGKLEGLLLGALDPAAHSASMVRRHWAGLAGHVLLAAVSDPRLGWDLAATRTLRYAGGLARVALRSRRGVPAMSPGPVSAAPSAPVESCHSRAGEITHLLVAPEAQGAGIGRLLVAAAEEAGRRAGLCEMVLVTPVEEWGARRFYERIGWVLDQPVTSASGEQFVRYRRALGPGWAPGPG